MEVLFSFSASTVTRMACYGALATIFSCYIIAVSQGNVPVWLPMISDCAVEPPESYLFRGGLISSAVLLNINSFFMLCYKSAANLNVDSDFSKFDLYTYLISVIATLGLITVGSVNEDENGTIHSAGAIVFFLFYLIYMILITARLWKYSSHNSQSLRIKTILTIYGVIVFAIFAVLSQDWGKYHTDIAFCEWTGTISIILFLLSFTLEYGNTLKIGALLQSNIVYANNPFSHYIPVKH